jgi:hypothetical protein
VRLDKQEASQILSEKAQELRSLTYDELRERYWGDGVATTVSGPSGCQYQLEIQAFWDDKAARTVRVALGIDDGGWRAFIPLTTSFIIAPDGSFVDDD